MIPAAADDIARAYYATVPESALLLVSPAPSKLHPQNLRGPDDPIRWRGRGAPDPIQLRTLRGISIVQR